MIITFFGYYRLEINTVFKVLSGFVLENHPDIVHPPILIGFGCLSIVIGFYRLQFFTRDVVVRGMEKNR